MRHERQMELLDRVADAGSGMVGLHAAESLANPASAYSDEGRFLLEQSKLFRHGPVFFALSAELRETGQYRTGVFDKIPIAVIRQADGGLKALVNACRHRGAPILDERPNGEASSTGSSSGGSSSGGSRSSSSRSSSSLKLLQCPYHAWTYELDGALKSRPASHGAFDDLPGNFANGCDLHQVGVAEHSGVIFVRPGGQEPIDIEQVLSGVQTDFGDFGLDKQIHVETRINTWNMNWKLVLDTFTEVYHVRTLHRDTIGPYFNSDCMIFEEFGPNMTATAFRKNMLDEMDKPRDERSILPYATVQYFVLPNALIVFQLDHFEVWRIEPIDVRTTKTTTSVFALEGPVDAALRAHLAKNLDVLLTVTGTEDFPLMERIQANLDSGALPEVVYGRNEAALSHFHRSLNGLLGLG